MNKAAQLYLLMYQLVWEDKQHQKFWAQFGESLLYTLPSPAAWLSQTQLRTYTATHSQERLVDDEDRAPRRGVEGRRGLGQVPNKGRGLSGRLGATQHSTSPVPPPHHYVSSIARTLNHHQDGSLAAVGRVSAADQTEGTVLRKNVMIVKKAMKQIDTSVGASKLPQTKRALTLLLSLLERTYDQYTR